MSSSTWTPPADHTTRPVAILGGGVLGRRIACCWASAGYTVHVRDPSPEQREAAVKFVEENVSTYAQDFTGCKHVGHAVAFAELAEAVANAWIVFEAVPEKLPIKIDTFAELEAHAPADAILGSNSSSYKSSEMLEKVADATKRRILNTHYAMPPKNMVVELMTDGHTEPAIFPFLVDRHREAGLKPYVARKESTGFIFNRVWAAVKREFLMIMDEGVSVPQELDELWAEVFGPKMVPCDFMDQVGLDTVALIEQHYIKERGLPSSHLEYLQENYVSKGKLGHKSSSGGFYASPPPKTNGTSTNGTAAATTNGTAAAATPHDPTIIVLDLGLSAPLADAGTAAALFHRGRILSIAPPFTTPTPLLTDLYLPDGVVIDHTATPPRMIWTHMGTPSLPDGSLHSALLDGSDARTLIAADCDGLHTPKQVALDAANGKVYVSDREGMRVVRCDARDGAGLETVVDAAAGDGRDGGVDQTRWCVGIAVDAARGRFWWTQKGPSKGGRGSVWGARMDDPLGSAECLLDGLPEPIDLQFDSERGELVWTDRGELPFGNTLNRVRLDGEGRVVAGGKEVVRRVVAQNFDEAIGLEWDGRNGVWYVADLGGTVWRVREDGRKEVVYHDKDCAFTGLALVY